MSTCALTARRVSPHSHLPLTRGGGPRLAISPYAPCERRGPSSPSAWHSPRVAWNVEAARTPTTDSGVTNDNYDCRVIVVDDRFDILFSPLSDKLSARAY